MPKISVIIPVYNVAPYLRECLDSVIHQTYTDIEVFLIDDGSTDESGAICDEYAAKDSRITVIHKKNEGQGKARNIGMDRARGKYIIFLDSDDYWELNTLEISHAEAEKNKTDILMFSSHSFVDGDGEIERTESIDVYKHSIGQVTSGIMSMTDSLQADEYMMSVCRRLYLREFLQETGIAFSEGCIHEDESFSFLSCIYAQRVEKIACVLYHRRWRSGSTMTQTIKDFQRSAHGYSVALQEVLEAYQRQKNVLNEREKELFIRQIHGYYYAVCGLHYKALCSSKKMAVEIANAEQIQLKKAAKVFPNLSLYERLCEYNLQIANRIRRLIKGLSVKKLGTE